jgi:hypothetical protein
MYTVDLHLKGETGTSAISNLYSSIKLAKKTKEKTLCLIVGQGSTGGTHKIKTAVLEELKTLKEKNQIKGYILGNEIDIFNSNYQSLKGKELIDKTLHGRMNAGQIVVIL